MCHQNVVVCVRVWMILAAIGFQQRVAQSDSMRGQHVGKPYERVIKTAEHNSLLLEHYSGTRKALRSIAAAQPGLMYITTLQHFCCMWIFFANRVDKQMRGKLDHVIRKLKTSYDSLPW